MALSPLGPHNRLPCRRQASVTVGLIDPIPDPIQIDPFPLKNSSEEFCDIKTKHFAQREHGAERKLKKQSERTLDK
jgi:hypothetical protein